MPIATLVVCGMLHIVGSERDTALVLDDGRQRIALEGPVANTFIGSTWNRICVEGKRTGHLAIGAAYSLRAGRVRPAGDGRHAPIVGIVRRSEHGDVIETADGSHFALRMSLSVASFIRTRIWLTGRWDRDAIAVAAIGPF
jgi:hypothetical protein